MGMEADVVTGAEAVDTDLFLFRIRIAAIEAWEIWLGKRGSIHRS